MLQSLALGPSIALFVACTLVIAITGTRLAGVVDRLADRTGLGEAIMGAVLMGLATSLSGSVLSTSAAASGHPELAMSNAVGGIAVQTLFLAVADLAYRRANLEHAAASLGNLLQGALLLTQLSWLLLAFAMPQWTIGPVHVVTPLLLVSYVYGLRLARDARAEPMWVPQRTRETREDEPDPSGEDRSLAGLLGVTAVLVALMGVAGFLMQRSATGIVDATGLDEALMGVLFTAVATSLPELVTTLFAAFSDVAYTEGSIYHAVSDRVVTWTALGAVMSAVLMLGLIRREPRGPGGIGFESVGLIGLYGLGVLTVLLA